MNQITCYAQFLVYLDDRHVGTINELYGEPTEGIHYSSKPGPVTGYKYIPKGQRFGGEVYPTLRACIQSLETPA